MATYLTDEDIWEIYTKVDPMMYKSYARSIEARVIDRIKGIKAELEAQTNTTHLQGAHMVTIQYESREEALLALKAPDYILAAEDFRSYLRLKQKHDELTEDQAKTLEDISTAFHDLFEGLLPL